MSKFFKLTKTSGDPVIVNRNDISTISRPINNFGGEHSTKITMCGMNESVYVKEEVQHLENLITRYEKS